MGYYYRRRPYSPYTANPLPPFPLILLLLVVSVLLGISRLLSFSEVLESAGGRINWLLLASTLLLLLAVRWLSSYDDRRRCMLRCGPPPRAGTSPWGVVALIALVLVLMQFRSIFLDRC